MPIPSFVDSLAQDLRYGFRALRKTPGFTAVAVISLGLGIGASSALFSVADALLLRPLRVRSPEQLVTLEQILPDRSRQYNFSYLDIQEFRALDAQNVFAGVAGISWADGYDRVTGSDRKGSAAERVRVGLVTGEYFPVIGVAAQLGRLFTVEDDRIVGGHPLAVISDAYWKQRFTRAMDVIGKPLVLNGTTYSVVGVTAAGFAGDWVGWPTDVWVPSAMAGPMMPSAEGRDLRQRIQYKLVARLRDAVSASQARAAAEIVYENLKHRPPPASGIIANARLDLVSTATGYSPQRPSFQQSLRVLLAMVAVVMLIVSANVANLLLARSAGRARELAVRLAVGATRARLARQLLTENLLLGSAGAAAGLLLSYWATDILLNTVASGPVSAVTSGIPSINLSVRPDGRVIAVTVALSILTTFVFGLLPAFRGSRVPVRTELTRWRTDSGLAGGAGPRKLLLVGQIAASVAVLVGAGLFVRTVDKLKAQDLGFDRDRLLLVWALPGPAGRQGPALLQMWEAIEDRISSLPGVVSASASVEGLLAGGPTVGPLVTADGRDAPQGPLRVESRMTIGPRFFETVGQELLDGREFTRDDAAAAVPVVIVNQSLARSVFGAERAVGRTLRFARSQLPPVEIVGVVRDARHNSPRAANAFTLYYAQGQNQRRLARALCVVVRTSGPPLALATAIRQELARIEPDLPVLRIDTVAEQLDSVLFQERLIAGLSVFFAVVALFLTCVGLYGVMSFLMTNRIAEIGIRLALGATRGQVMRTVFRDTAVVVLWGAVLGVPLTVASVRLTSSMLFGVSAADPSTIGVVLLLMASVAGVAVFVPAWRASRVDPISALRAD